MPRIILDKWRNTKTYRGACSYCSSVVEFFGHEGRSSSRGGCVLDKCPCCKVGEIHVAHPRE